jgi:electron transport complex protein RnfB
MPENENFSLSQHDLRIYLDFIEWQKQSWYGAPDSENLLPYVSARCTPQEAALLTGVPFSFKTLADLSDLKGIDPETLRRELDGLALKGLVNKQVKDGVPRYSLQDLFTTYRTFGWPGRKDPYSQTVGPPGHRYLAGGALAPWEKVREKGLRVLPIGTAIEDTRSVLPYEEIRQILDQVEYFTVSHCPCRIMNNLDPDSPDCRYPTEVCLHFDKLGRYIVENGLGREISRQETEEILRRSAELGLVHGISNQQEKPDTICNCCRDCCIWFLALKKYGHGASLTPSNFHIAIHQETCIGCGLCAKRCPMEAVQLVDRPEVKGRKTTVRGKDGKPLELTNQTGKVAEVNLDRCIGCGVCAYKCPSRSLGLVRKPSEHPPPKTGRDWFMQFLADTGGVQAFPRSERSSLLPTR